MDQDTREEIEENSTSIKPLPFTAGIEQEKLMHWSSSFSLRVLRLSIESLVFSSTR